MEIIVHNGKKEVMLRGSNGDYEFCEQRNIKKNGVAAREWAPYAWFSSLEAALSRLADIKISNSAAKTFEELQIEVRKVRKEITDIYGTGI